MKLLRILGGLTAAGLGAAAWGYSELTKFELKEYTLPLLPKGTLRGKSEFRLLHLSDPVSYTHLTLPTTPYV